MTVVRLVSAFLSVGLALAVSDPVLLGSHGLRYEYHTDPDGVPHLVDTWMKLSDLQKLARYNPDVDNQYHLFTRANPTMSQPLLYGNEAILSASNFDARKKTVVLVHGWTGSVTSASNTVLIPAILTAADANVIGLDWSVGAAEPSFPNALASAQSVASFLNWLSATTGMTGDDLVIIGFSLGAQQAGMIGRYIDDDVSYISALDPPKRGFEYEIRASDAIYTEVIHTNVDSMGDDPIGHVDFYPNGGDNNPGCGNSGCNHARAYFFMAESLISGGFTGVQCESHQHALNGTCSLPGTLNMGGLEPKTGSTGIYYLQTNAAPPFSMG